MISDPWLPSRTLRTDEDRRLDSSDRRDVLRAMRRCINGPKVGNVGRRGVVHGPVYKGGRCERCWKVKGGN